MYADNKKPDPGKQPDAGEQDDKWSAGKINRSWFIQIQALGKLYRKDCLTSSHPANMSCYF